MSDANTCLSEEANFIAVLYSDIRRDQFYCILRNLPGAWSPSPAYNGGRKCCQVVTLAACGGGSSTTNSKAPVYLTVWLNPAVPEVAPPPSNWSLYSIVRQKLNINLKVELLPLGTDGNDQI